MSPAERERRKVRIMLCISILLLVAGLTAASLSAWSSGGAMGPLNVAAAFVMGWCASGIRRDHSAIVAMLDEMEVKP